MTLKDADLAVALCELHGVTDESNYEDKGIQKVYFRGPHVEAEDGRVLLEVDGRVENVGIDFIVVLCHAVGDKLLGRCRTSTTS